ncbi:MAG TPA: hypothetical protein VGJ80_06340 [Gemmatimonadales bacterium]|jgi:hypothetical protein
MSNLSGSSAAARGTFSSSSTQEHHLGQYLETKDGRGFRYALAGAVALVAGNALQNRVEESTHDALVVVTGAANATTITLTTEAASGALDANEYADGLAVIDTTPGEGYSYHILSHPAVLASSNGVITLYPDDPIQVALTTSSRVTLIFHPYSKVIQFPVTTATGVCVGIAPYPIAIAEYGWVQTHGLCGALIAGTPAIGAQVTAVGAVAGALSIISGTLPLVGHMADTGRDTKICPVFLNID